MVKSNMHSCLELRTETTSISCRQSLWTLNSCKVLAKDVRQTANIMAGMAVFNVAGYLKEERHRWPVITASPRGQCSK